MPGTGRGGSGPTEKAIEPGDRECAESGNVLHRIMVVIAGAVAGFVISWVDSSRDAWLVFGTGLALAAVAGAFTLTRERQRQAMPEADRYLTPARAEGPLLPLRYKAGPQSLSASYPRGGFTPQ